MAIETLLERFTEMANNRRAEIVELQHIYLLKQIQNEIIRERFNVVYNKVLSENPFYAEREFSRNEDGCRISKGDRILSCTHHYLMSTKDFDRYLEICLKEFYKAGLTDEEGKFTEETNTENQLTEIKNKLIRLSVEILPDDFPNKKLLEDAIEYKGRNSCKIRETLFELVMKLR